MRREEGPADLLLVCSSGGHLLQLHALEPAWRDFSRVWITFDKSDARSLLRDEQVVFAHGPTNRSLKNLVRNLWLAWRVVARIRPAVVLTTGAGVAVPFAWVGRLRGARVVVTHAGVGSIMVALAERLRPVVVPRLRRFGEAVDDHQLTFGQHFARAGLVTLVEDPELLSAELAGSSDRSLAWSRGDSKLALELRDYLGERIPRAAQRAALEAR